MGAAGHPRSRRGGVRRAGLLLAAAAGCTTLAPAPVEVPAGGHAHAGTHFTIVCHFECGPAGERALEVAELTWSHAAEMLGRDAAPRASRPIHLYRTEQEYEDVEAGLTGGRFRLNRAMTYRGIEAHISVHPHLTRTALREYGLTTNTLRVVAHEAAHIAMRTLQPRTRDLPDWLDEGLATSLELDVLMDLGLAASRTDEPVSSTRLYLLRERVRRGTLPSLSALLLGREGGMSLAERYAFYQHFMDFLRSGRYRTRLESTVLALGDVGGTSARLRRLLITSILGVEPDALDAVDGDFRAWLQSSEPGWVQTRRALSIDGSEWLQIGFSGGAEAWRWTPRAQPPYVLSGGVRILENAEGTASVLVALPERARLALVFAPAELRLERHRFAGDPTPEVLVRQPRPERAPGRPFPFRIAVDSTEVRATVEGAAEMRTELVTASRWGLATGPGANVVWSDITVEAQAR